jgi:pilus assembly protein FimV
MVEKTGFYGRKIVDKVTQNRSTTSTTELKIQCDKRRSISESIKRACSLGPLTLMLGLSFLTTTAHALGLGQLTTLSSLNEPFEAEIELLSSTSDELQTVSVQLASPEHFKNAGVDRLFQLSQLKFEIVEDPSRGNYLRLTSPDPMREPYLNFLLEVNWSKGRLVREYTALIDPPTYDSGSRVANSDLPIAQTEPVIAEAASPAADSDFTISQLPDATLVTEEQVESGEVVNASGSSAAQPAPVRSAPTPRTVSPRSNTSDSYSTRKGDTLWGIATRVKPNPSLSVQQMMMSLLNANPEAFINNNINSLKTGQVLRIPDTSEVDQLTKSDAIALVKEHNALWDDYRQGLAESVPFRPEGAVSSAGTSVSEPEIAETTPVAEPEVRLVTAQPEAELESATSVEESTANVSSDDEGKDLSLLQDELAVVQEQLSSRDGENEELKSRLQETDEIISLLKQQVELKNQELAALQAKLRESDQAVTLTESTETASVDEKQTLIEETVESTEAPETTLEETPSVTEETRTEENQDESIAEKEKPASSIDELLAELDESETDSVETSYVNNDNFIAPETADPSIYAEYDAPAVNLTGQDSPTVYQDGSISSSTPSETATQTPEPSTIEEPIAETSTEKAGWLEKIKAYLPAGIVEKIPGGDSGLLGVLGALLLLVIFAIFKLLGGGKKDDDSETLDLLSPDELDDQGKELDDEIDDTLLAAETDVIDADESPLQDLLDEDDAKRETADLQDSLSDLDDLGFEGEETAEELESDFDDLNLDDDLDLDSEKSTQAEVDEETGLDDLSNEGEEISLSEMANLEDTLEHIKPLLDQTEEEYEENDPLEEVNISLAYEQFDKAERLVTEAIENNPNEDGYKLRLLEVHYAANNPPAFESAARALHTSTGGEGHLWESAESMWSELSPDRDLFAEEETVAPIADNTLTPEENNTVEISDEPSLKSTGIIAGMSAAGSAVAASLATTDLSETESTTDGLSNENDLSLDFNSDDFSLDIPTNDEQETVSDLELSNENPLVEEKNTEELELTDAFSLDDSSLELSEELIDTTDLSGAESDVSSLLATDEPVIETPKLESEDVFDITGATPPISEEAPEEATELTADDDFFDITGLTNEVDKDSELSLDSDTELDLDLTLNPELSEDDLTLDMPDLADLDEADQELASLTDDAKESLLGATQPGDADALANDLDELSSLEVAEEDTPEIDLLDITAAGLNSDLDGTDEQDAQELFELSHELKSDDESVLSDLATSVTDMELSDAIDSFTPAEADSKDENSDEIFSLDPNLLDSSLSGDDELDALARSLEDTISGLEGAGLDDMSLEFDADGELERTLSSTLGVSSDLTHDFDTESDEIDTKLNLAKAYIELGDAEGAKDILNEVSQEGNEQQKQDAQELLGQIS